jgi:hypothetical protein
VALALKVAVCPAVTATLAGAVAMAGATGFTVSVASALVMLPALLVTTTR